MPRSATLAFFGERHALTPDAKARLTDKAGGGGGCGDGGGGGGGATAGAGGGPSPGPSPGPGLGHRRSRSQGVRMPDLGGLRRALGDAQLAT